jgi:RNA polymerase sigma-70 factor (ECF subfamily)
MSPFWSVTSFHNINKELLKMTFQEIIRLIDEKNPKGWENLFVQYGQKFYGFAVINWKFSEDEAWEIVHQTLETIILKIGEYEIESQSHFDNLLFKIFTNFLRQYYRKKKRIEEDFLLIPLGEMEISNSDGESEFDLSKASIPFDKGFFKEYFETEETDNPKLKELDIALSKLNPLEKDLLLLKANGFTYDQIANMLQIENNQLKVKHYRAKLKLIKFLQTIKL